LETPRNDASIGLLLRGDGKGHFLPIPAQESGLYLDGEVMNSSKIAIGSMKEKHILLGINNDSLQLIRVKKQKIK
jgi:hypothetical protein